MHSRAARRKAFPVAVSRNRTRSDDSRSRAQSARIKAKPGHNIKTASVPANPTFWLPGQTSRVGASPRAAPYGSTTARLAPSGRDSMRRGDLRALVPATPAADFPAPHAGAPVTHVRALAAIGEALRCAGALPWLS